ncbi:hypothetical protein SAMN05443247_00048 [Bradyrhizobium erythrophlei]|nr:hypothetical protein SAMN05443247_00048 [Bradyrhizobium erythrophlei]
MPAAHTETGLIADWKSLCADVATCAVAIFETAEVKITPQGFADPQFLALTLLARTLSNLKGAAILLDARRIIEARTITRCCFENLYWMVGLVEHGPEFVKRMRDDELSHRKATGQALFELDLALDDDVEDRLREFMRDLNKRGLVGKTLSPKAVSAFRKDFGKTYVFYSQLSSDSAHPSVTALNRYTVANHLAGPGFDVEPLVRPDEIIETYEYLAMSCIGVCVGVNQIIGGTKGGERLNSLADRKDALSIAAAALRKA